MSRIVACMLAVLLGVATASVARAAGEMGDPSKKKDEGAHFFGFVRDAAGKALPEDKVVLEIAGGTRYVTRTGKNGMYRFGGLNKSVTPDNVTISCEKEKYRQARVIRKPLPRGKQAVSVETECRMQAE